jgi:hypothetical protein
MVTDIVAFRIYCRRIWGWLSIGYELLEEMDYGTVCWRERLPFLLYSCEMPFKFRLPARLSTVNAWNKSRFPEPIFVKCYISFNELCQRIIIQLTNSWDCRLPTAAAGVRSQDWSCETCGGESGTVVDFLRVFLFSLQILIPPAAPYSWINLSSALYSLDAASVVK